MPVCATSWNFSRWINAGSWKFRPTFARRACVTSFRSKTCSVRRRPSNTAPCFRGRMRKTSSMANGWGRRDVSGGSQPAQHGASAAGQRTQSGGSAADRRRGPTGALVGERLVFGRAVYSYKVLEAPYGLYVGGSIEAGRMERPLVPGSPTGVLKSVAAFLAVEYAAGAALSRLWVDGGWQPQRLSLPGTPMT